ncbi:unnamed protein product [Caenorhabditis auriculariae]|uniref:Uncharacterized protein n=1 Tax=Caenorhabditis auriculariae TaxID=2777116 RepID=A0A8S1HV22_9PELO|nr:unnamed protein product [Caenorhabditis auriculariae]
MVPSPLRRLRRSISDRFLGKHHKSEQPSPKISEERLSAQQSIEEDPYREILRCHEDNVSHLIYHGSSLRSMTSCEWTASAGATPTRKTRKSGRNSLDTQHLAEMNNNSLELQIASLTSSGKTAKVVAFGH